MFLGVRKIEMADFFKKSQTDIPDFIVRIEDGNLEDPLNLNVEIKGFRSEDAKQKKETMEVCMILDINKFDEFGRWAFAEFTDV